MPDQTAARIREAVAAMGPRGPRTPIPTEIKAEVVAYSHERRSRGVSWERIATAVGFSASTVQRWAASNRPAPSPLPVLIRSEPAETARPIVLVSPSGYRLEGLTLEQAAAVLQALA